MLIDRNTFNISKCLNRYKGARAFLAGKKLHPGLPVECIVEITNQCNLSCVMCPRAGMKRPVGFMDLKTFQNIIDQVKDYIEIVYISGGLGEPLLHPKLGEMIRYCRKNNVRVGVSTNATVLNPDMTKVMLDAGPDLLLLSLDAATKELYEKIRVGSNFERTMLNVENFLLEKSRRRMPRPFTIAQMVYMPENESEKDIFYAKWKAFKGLNDIRLKKFLHLQGARRIPNVDSKSRPPSGASCILPWRQISIAWDGSMSLCCRDLDSKYPLDNVKSTTIERFWNCEKLKQLRHLLASGHKQEIPLCAGCETIKVNALTCLGSILIDDFSIRKMLPMVEKIFVKTNLGASDY